MARRLLGSSPFADWQKKKKKKEAQLIEEPKKTDTSQQVTQTATPPPLPERRPISTLAPLAKPDILPQGLRGFERTQQLQTLGVGGFQPSPLQPQVTGAGIAPEMQPPVVAPPPPEITQFKRPPGPKIAQLADGSYTIDGVPFSAEEYAEYNEVLAGGGRSSNNPKIQKLFDDLINIETQQAAQVEADRTEAVSEWEVATGRKMEAMTEEQRTAILQAIQEKIEFGEYSKATMERMQASGIFTEEALLSIVSTAGVGAAGGAILGGPLGAAVGLGVGTVSGLFGISKLKHGRDVTELDKYRTRAETDLKDVIASMGKGSYSQAEAIKRWRQIKENLLLADAALQRKIDNDPHSILTGAGDKQVEVRELLRNMPAWELELMNAIARKGR